VEGKPQSDRKMVTPRVLAGKRMLDRKAIVIVPKGDPRARPPAATHAPLVLKAGATASAACTAKPGRCVLESECVTLKGTLFRGICPGKSVCCTKIPPPAPANPNPVTPPNVDEGECPFYDTLARTSKVGNNNKLYDTVPIKPEHMTEPQKSGWNDRDADNTMRLQPTACAFARMEKHAAADGVILKIASGFRSFARQKYFYDCFLTGKCNDGNKAAKPGSSNHGVGLALDLNTDCGKQKKGGNVPKMCASSKVYQWLLKNYKTTGFIRAVDTEPWHWEYRPGQAMPAYA